MKKLIAALLFLPSLATAAYIPVNGSTVNIQNVLNPVTVTSGSGTWAVNGSTMGVVQVLDWVVSKSTIGHVQVGDFAISKSTIGHVQVGDFTVSKSTIGVIEVGDWVVSKSTIGVVGILSNNGAAAATNMVPDLPAIAQNAYANNASAYTQGRNVALNVGTLDGLLRVSNLPNITDASYSVSTGTFAMATSTADFTGMCGNNVSTVAVTGLRISCTETTAGVVPIAIAKRSTGYTAIWSTITVAGEDSNYAISHSTAMFFTAFPHTDGTLVTYVDFGQIGCMAAGTASPNDIYISPANWRMKPIILRKVTDCLGANVQSTTVTGNKWTVTWEWMEFSSP